METTGSFEDYVKLQISGSDWSYGSRWGDQMESAIRYIFSPQNDREKISIIDIGCGEGRGLKALHSIGYRNLCGIDISSEKLERARTTSSGDITYICGDFHNTDNLISEHLSLQQMDGFDYGFCSHTLEHAMDFTKAIQSIVSVIRKRFHFIVPIGETPEQVATYNPSHTSPFLDLKDVQSKLIKAGISDYALNTKGLKDGRLCDEVWGIIWCKR